MFIVIGRGSFLNKAIAMKRMKVLLSKYFHYIYKEVPVRDPYEIHLCYQMDSNRYELQSQMNFKNGYVDILTFISPRLLTPNTEVFDIAIKVINYINWVTKSTTGKFYVDDYGDITYAIRFPYWWFEYVADRLIREYTIAIQFYEDLFTLLLYVTDGKYNYEEAKEFIDEMWNM